MAPDADWQVTELLDLLVHNGARIDRWADDDVIIVLRRLDQRLQAVFADEHSMASREVVLGAPMLSYLGEIYETPTRNQVGRSQSFPASDPLKI
jgi:hypothetical protein